jgi:hypothetical protein
MTLSLRALFRASPFATWLAALALASTAVAQDTSRPLMASPTGFTDVADAFEEGDPVDVNLQLGYAREMSSGTIEREVVDNSSQDARSTRHHVDVAHVTRITNELALRLEVGIYHDLMLFARLPIVLSDDNELRPVSGQACSADGSSGCPALQEPVGGSAAAPSTKALFDLSRTLASPRRSGVPTFDFGVAWAVTNQYRVAHLPTWVLILQGSANTGTVMRACLQGQAGCDPGVSRGTAKLALESRWSYRYRYVEPFMGISHTVEWVAGGERVFSPLGKLDGVVDDGPPSMTDGTLGAAFFPWEDRVRYQRVEVDLRGAARFISSGRDFSPLFDALGASKNPQLTAPVFAPGNRSAVPFTGLTNVAAHARLGFESQLVVQAARYVRFSFGLGLFYLTSHLITGAPACDAGVQASASDPRVAGCDSGIYNPVHRPAIDTPGRRFLLEGDVMVRLAAAATGQF